MINNMALVDTNYYVHIDNNITCPAEAIQRQYIFTISDPLIYLKLHTFDQGAIIVNDNDILIFIVDFGT